MFFRLLTYVFWGWLCMAMVAGLAPILHLSVLLPATTVVLLVHLAFSRWRHLHWGLGVAICLGYLEDLHQGAPIGVLSTVYAFGWLALYRAAGRFTVVGPGSTLLAVGIACLGFDLATWALLSVLADRLGFGHAALNAALGDIGWHLLGTLLFAPAVWWVADKLIHALDELLLEEPVTVDGGRSGQS